MNILFTFSVSARDLYRQVLGHMTHMVTKYRSFGN